MYEASRILGVSLQAGENEVKSAYKALVKKYHPDSGICENTDMYYSVREAYEIMCKYIADKAKISYNYMQNSPYNYNNIIYGNNNYGNAQNVKGYSVKPRIIGNTSSSYHNYGADSASFEKRYQKQKEEKLRRVEENAKKYSEDLKRKEEEYKKAMDAISTIILAERIKAILNDAGT